MKNLDLIRKYNGPHKYSHYVTWLPEFYFDDDDDLLLGISTLMKIHLLED